MTSNLAPHLLHLQYSKPLPRDNRTLSTAISTITRHFLCLPHNPKHRMPTCLTHKPLRQRQRAFAFTPRLHVPGQPQQHRPAERGHCCQKQE
jgi:hypothetical protein